MDRHKFLSGKSHMQEVADKEAADAIQKKKDEAARAKKQAESEKIMNAIEKQRIKLTKNDVPRNSGYGGCGATSGGCGG